MTCDQGRWPRLSHSAPLALRRPRITASYKNRPLFGSTDLSARGIAFVPVRVTRIVSGFQLTINNRQSAIANLGPWTLGFGPFAIANACDSFQASNNCLQIIWQPSTSLYVRPQVNRRAHSF